MLRKGRDADEADRKNSHSTELRGGACHRSAEASGSEDLQVEEPVSCWDGVSFHLHATLASMLGTTLIWDEVVQMCEAREKGLLTATGMVKPFHGEQLPLDSVWSSWCYQSHR